MAIPNLISTAANAAQVTTSQDSAGMLFRAVDDWNSRSWMQLPFVPTQTQVSRNLQYVEVSPPGNSGSFHQFTQGGSHKLQMDLFLNDLYKGDGDGFNGSWSPGSTGSDFSVTSVDGVLKWLTRASNAQYDQDNVWRGPSILSVLVAQDAKGMYVITSIGVKVSQRFSRLAPDGKRGRVARATVSIVLAEYNTIPMQGMSEFQW